MDHVNHENYIINWNEASESDKTTRWIREAVKIRQESQGVMNRDEGSLPVVLYGDSSLKKTAAAVETSLKILLSYLRLFQNLNVYF